MVYHYQDHYHCYHFAFDQLNRWLLGVTPFSATATHLVEILFLRVAYPNDRLNAPGLVFETEMMVQKNLIAELNEIEAWVVLVYPVSVFAPFLFELNLPVFRLQVPVQPTLIPVVLLSFHSLKLHLFLFLALLLLLPEKNFL
jgi:hypothetical protein